MNVAGFSEADQRGLAHALAVVRLGVRTQVSEADEKLLGFFLRHGECDARIVVPVIEVRFSWLRRRKPSTYFGALAPGLVSQLMDLGSIPPVQDEAEFVVGPGSAGTDTYRFSFARKWVRIACSNEAILIQVRDQRHDLTAPLRFEGTRETSKGVGS